MATNLWIVLAVNQLTQAIPKMGTLWSNGLSNNTDKMIDRIESSIPDEITYLSKIAEPAEQEFRNLLNPAFVSRKGKTKDRINETQAYKINKAWNKYKRNRDHMFETVDGVVAKRFKDKVAASKNNYGERLSETTLSFTGIKSMESGPVRIAIYWLTGDLKARRLLRQSDRIMAPSEPFCITLPGEKNSLRMLLNSRLVQSGMAILHSRFSPAVITEMNDIDNHQAQSLVDPGLGLMPFATGANSHLDYIVENGQLFLSVKVSQI